MERTCPVCEYTFHDGDEIIAVMRSMFKKIESDVHYAITTPTDCLEIMHFDCYDFPAQDDSESIGGVN